MNHSGTDRLIGESSCFLEALEQASSAATLTKPILVVGERGTGKELVASRLHFLSPRWDKPFLKLNCAAINENLIDSELFGHEAGAFSGAQRQHKGLFEQADGGTLFLDELATTAVTTQEKLLRVLEYGEIRRVGSSQTINIDVRLVAATHSHLPNLVKQNKFRADLLDRLAFDVITLPPLRVRQEDILLLAEHFALKMTQDLGRDFFAGFSKQAEQQLKSYNWPGNVRELKNVVERSIYRCKKPNKPLDKIIIDPFQSSFTEINTYLSESKTNAESIQSADSENKTNSEHNNLPQSQPKKTDLYAIFVDSRKEFKPFIQNIEIEIIKKTLAEQQFNQVKTAEALGFTYHQLRAYLRKYKLI